MSNVNRNRADDIMELEDRLRDVIHTRCNPIGCKDCDLHNGDGTCAATDLQGKIMDLEMNHE